METLLNSVWNGYRRNLESLAAIIIFLSLQANLSAAPRERISYLELQGSKNWEICWDTGYKNDHNNRNVDSPPALSCKPQVNVSLGQDGYAILTALLLVNAPVHPIFLYEVDIMGPLNDTAFCAQLGQELMVVVTDPTGNSCMSTVFIEDKLKPVLTCTPDTLPCNINIQSINFEDYLDAVTDNCDPDPDVYYSYVIQNLPCNPHHFTQQIVVTWTATDNSGNSATCQDIIYLKRPALGQIVFPPDISISCVNANIDPSVTGQPTFNGNPIGFTCQLVVFHTDQVVPMCNGAQKIIRLWTVMDWCNSGQVTDVQEILIIDNVPPVITCPFNITIGTDPGVCTTKYTLPLPVVTDACSDDSMIDIDITVGGVLGIFSPGAMVNLGIGITLITIRATDACGNSSVCHYNVTVRDNTPPIPICHTIVVPIGANGMGFLVAANLNFPIIENCGILSKQIWRMTNTCNTPEDLQPGPDVKFCCADVGDTLLVVFKVTDVSGNMNTCMFQVIVVDLIPPVAECKNITVSVANGGNIIITPSQINDGSTDNCSITSLTVTPNNFDCEDIGVNVVTLTVTDQSGNTSTCTATVTITDNVPPVAVCENITVTVNSNGDVSITAEQINNGSTDNCAIDTIFLNQYDFDCDDEGSNVVVLTVVDFAGNTATCTATVTVLTSPPVALCRNITVSLNAAGSVTITPAQINNGSFDDCGIDTITVNPSTFNCTQIGVNTVTLTVTDGSGNTSTCTASVTVQDNTPPNAQCQNIMVMLDENGMASITALQINNGSTDNCTIISITVTPTNFDCDDAGPNIVTLTVTDQSGNTSTCTAIVTVAMPDPPEAICQNITVTLGPGGTVTIDPEDIDNGSSSQCGDVTLELDEDTFDCDDLGLNVVTLTVTDEAGASSTCTAVVTVLEAPPVAICQNITVSLNAAGTITITASQVNNNSTDDCGIEFITVTPATFDCEDIGPNVVTLTVTDSSGLSSTCTATVTVIDNTPPLAICQNITVTIDGGNVIITAADVDNGSSDNCDSISLSVTPNTFDCADVGPNTVTLTVTDEAGNTSTCTATVTVTLTPPVALCQNITVSLGANGLVVILPEDVDNGSNSDCGFVDLSLDENIFDCLEIGANIVVLTVTDEAGGTSTCTATVTVVDNLAPLCNAADISVSLNGSGNVTITAAQVNDGSTDNCFIDTITVTPTSFNCTNLGPNIVTLTVTDQSGNSSTCTAIVTVVDVTDPICNAQDLTVTIDESGIAVITGADINDGSTDNCGPLTFSVDPDTFDCEDIGTNVVTLTVTDGSGNSSTCTATVTVTSEPPQAICQDITISVGPDGFVVVLPEDVDNGSEGNCGDQNLSISQDTFDCTDIGDNIIILTVTDASGATSTCTATVTVTDEFDPICSAADLTVYVDEAGNATVSAVMINNGSSDNCGVVTLDLTPTNFTCDDIGPNEVTLTVTDDSGNTSTCTATVTVLDTIAPICNAQDISVSINGTSITILPSQVDDGSSDNCGPVTLDVDPNTFDCEDLGDNEVTLTVTDASGNTSTCTAIVTVDDSEGLVANCQNVTILIDSNGDAFVDPEDVDNGSGGGCGSGNLEFDLSQTQFDCGDLGMTTVTLTVTDEEGNTSTCTAIITVIDPLPPQITCPDNLTINCTEINNPDNTDQFGNATATDNCDFVVITETHVINLNDCNVGSILRTFTATDGSGNTATCTQQISVINTNPFTEDDITWPPSPISVNICNSTNPPNTGQPTFAPGSLQCANPVAMFTDVVQTFIDNNPNTFCKIITRTWVVTDNCQPNGTFTFVQTINVTDMVGPVFININDMTKVANANCVAAFTVIASATDCAGVTITNNSPFGATSGANASGNYPIGSTTVIFTATDGCGNITTMDVVLTVTDPDPTDFLCEKVIIILPPETEIAVNAETFITFLPGGCTDQNDFIISYSNTNPFDTVRIYDCGDVGVSTFSLYFWNLDGTEIVDFCDNADLDLRDPDDNCQDGLILSGNVESEDGLAVSGVSVNIMNVTMTPGTTNAKGEYLIEGLNEGVGYEVAPFNDKNHREGVSTLDLVLIQKHLLGRSKLNSPYKMIAADANKSGHLTAFDLLEIRKVILGINTRFPNNTSWRFIDEAYVFTDPYNPFNEIFSESVWIDSVSEGVDTANFVAIKVGDVNASYFLAGATGSKIEQRTESTFIIEGVKGQIAESSLHMATLVAQAGQREIDGFQMQVMTGQLSNEQLSGIRTDILTDDQWYYDPAEGAISISWSSPASENISGKLILGVPGVDVDIFELHTGHISPEAYRVDDSQIEIRPLKLIRGEGEELVTQDYHLFQNKPNPFDQGTTISFNLPQAEQVRLVIHDMTGKMVYDQQGEFPAGKSEVMIQATDIRVPGMYYYTLYTSEASFTRKMSFTRN